MFRKNRNDQLEKARANASAERDQSVFDANALLGRLMNDRQLASTILKAFVQDIPCQLNNLRERLGENDAAGVKLHVHTLKGASSTIAATRLHAVAMEMEQTTAATLVSHCIELMPKAAEEVELFKNTLTRTGWIQDD